MEREKFSSRLGFILISAGCAIGLGNVWRFPYITGAYGGAAFVLIYLFFLVILGLPIMVMEFAVGRASQKSAALSFDVLEPKGTKWHIYKWGAMAGNYLLMMFYTTIGGWMILYFAKMASGSFQGLDSEGVAAEFGNLMGQPGLMTFCMVLVVAICFAICAGGLQKGVERITKVMMLCLLALMIVLAIHSVFLEGGAAGLEFYLKPDFGKLMEVGLGEAVFAAMGQAFFTLSLGIGAIAIFGSYIGKERALTGEAVSVTVLDTCVALMAGLIIFPACFAYNVQPDSGPSLIFITLPNVFGAMAGGRIWGTLFFLFMSFAAMSTIIAVFENIISFAMDLTGCSRKKAVLVNLIAIILLSMPCVLGFNVLSGFTPFGAGSNVLDLEDFIVSNNLLPLGSLVYLMFCTNRYGWGYRNFMQEANTGTGIKFPGWVRGYVSYVLPLIVLFIFVQGYAAKFAQPVIAFFEKLF
ncbi:MAG: sodium-dependent transporter [Eubacteriales bacterium]|nr:sodium-dependent transporter [Eubacteriales bacterium]